MDLVSVSIIAALNVGIGEPIKDAYNALKLALRQKIGKGSDIVEAMKMLEKNPKSEPRRAMLQEEIATTQAHKDDELNQLAKALLKKLENQITGDDKNSMKAQGNYIAQANRGSTAKVIIGKE